MVEEAVSVMNEEEIEMQNNNHEDDEQDNGEEEYAYLAKYKLKFVHCFKNVRILSDEDRLMNEDAIDVIDNDDEDAVAEIPGLNNAPVSTTRRSGHGIGGVGDAR